MMLKLFGTGALALLLVCTGCSATSDSDADSPNPDLNRSESMDNDTRPLPGQDGIRPGENGSHPGMTPDTDERGQSIPGSDNDQEQSPRNRSGHNGGNTEPPMGNY